MITDFIGRYTEELEDECPNLTAVRGHNAATLLAKEVEHSTLRQYVNSRSVGQGHWPRMSQLGKPLYLQALSNPHIQAELLALGVPFKERITERLLHIFWSGDIFEAWVLFKLRQYGFDIIWPDPEGNQVDLEIDGVKGHADILVRHKGTDYVVEVKTMSGRYFSQFVGKPPEGADIFHTTVENARDDRGYRTQLALYSHCLSAEPLWFCVDKSTHTMALVSPSPDDMKQAVKEARQNIPKLRALRSFADTAQFTKPEGIPERYQRQETGRMLLPAELRYCPAVELFYETFEDYNGRKKLTTYCGDERITWHMDPCVVLDELKRGKL